MAVETTSTESLGIEQHFEAEREHFPRWFETAVTAVPIVVVQPALKRGGPMSRTWEGQPVGPLAKHGANEALGLAVRARRVGPRPAVHQTPRATGGGVAGAGAGVGASNAS